MLFEQDNPIELPTYDWKIILKPYYKNVSETTTVFK